MGINQTTYFNLIQQGRNRRLTQKELDRMNLFRLQEWKRSGRKGRYPKALRQRELLSGFSIEEKRGGFPGGSFGGLSQKEMQDLEKSIKRGVSGQQKAQFKLRFLDKTNLTNEQKNRILKTFTGKDLARAESVYRGIKIRANSRRSEAKLKEEALNVVKEQKVSQNQKESALEKFADYIKKRDEKLLESDIKAEERLKRVREARREFIKNAPRKTRLALTGVDIVIRGGEIGFKFAKETTVGFGRDLAQSVTKATFLTAAAKENIKSGTGKKFAKELVAGKAAKDTVKAFDPRTAQGATNLATAAILAAVGVKAGKLSTKTGKIPKSGSTAAKSFKKNTLIEDKKTGKISLIKPNGKVIRITNSDITSVSKIKNKLDIVNKKILKQKRRELAKLNKKVDKKRRKDKRKSDIKKIEKEIAKRDAKRLGLVETLESIRKKAEKGKKKQTKSDKRLEKQNKKKIKKFNKEVAALEKKRFRQKKKSDDLKRIQREINKRRRKRNDLIKTLESIRKKAEKGKKKQTKSDKRLEKQNKKKIKKFNKEVAALEKKRSRQKKKSDDLKRIQREINKRRRNKNDAIKTLESIRKKAEKGKRIRKKIEKQNRKKIKTQKEIQRLEKEINKKLKKYTLKDKTKNKTKNKNTNKIEKTKRKTKEKRKKIERRSNKKESKQKAKEITSGKQKLLLETKTKKSLKSKTRYKFQPLFAQRSKQNITDITKERPKTESKTKQKTITITEPKQKQKRKVRFIFKGAQRQAQKQAQEQIQKKIQKQKQKQKTKRRIKKRNLKSRIKIKLPNITKKKKTQSLRQGYNAYARSKGKLVRVNKEPLPRNRALRLAARVANNTTSASIKIKKSAKKTSKKDIKKPKVLDLFRKSKRGKTKVEKRKYRINTRGEKRGLTVAKYLKKRRRK